MKKLIIYTKEEYFDVVMENINRKENSFEEQFFKWRKSNESYCIYEVHPFMGINIVDSSLQPDYEGIVEPAKVYVKVESDETIKEEDSFDSIVLVVYKEVPCKNDRDVLNTFIVHSRMASEQPVSLDFIKSLPYKNPPSQIKMTSKDKSFEEIWAFYNSDCHMPDLCAVMRMDTFMDGIEIGSYGNYYVDGSYWLDNFNHYYTTDVYHIR